MAPPWRARAVEHLVSCLGADYVRDAAADVTPAGAAASSSPEAGQAAHESDQDKDFNQVVPEMVRAENERQKQSLERSPDQPPRDALPCASEAERAQHGDALTQAGKREPRLHAHLQQ